MVASLREVVAVLDGLYDPSWAESWDAVGTAIGDPDAPVERILFAVDPVQAVAEEAVDGRFDLVVTHHPLWLSGVTSIATTDPKGQVAHTLATHGIALHTCHTNADVPAHGVSSSMAEALCLTEIRPLDPSVGASRDIWTVFVPAAHVDVVREAMHAAGAGRYDGYDQAAFSWSGQGRFRPLADARPAVGRIGEIEHVDEVAVRLVAAPGLRESVREALLRTHPYEVPAYDIVVAEPEVTDRGMGRIGRLAEPTNLADFAETVRQNLPRHDGAIRVAGDLDRPVRTVALCGGSGDFLLGRATAAGADVYVTSDLKHHAVSEHLERLGSCAVIDVPHWAAEWTWLPVAAACLADRLDAKLYTHISTIVTDPWSKSLTC